MCAGVNAFNHVFRYHLTHPVELDDLDVASMYRCRILFFSWRLICGFRIAYYCHLRKGVVVQPFFSLLSTRTICRLTVVNILQDISFCNPSFVARTGDGFKLAHAYAFACGDVKHKWRIKAVCASYRLVLL